MKLDGQARGEGSTVKNKTFLGPSSIIPNQREAARASGATSKTITADSAFEGHCQRVLGSPFGEGKIFVTNFMGTSPFADILGAQPAAGVA